MPAADTDNRFLTTTELIREARGRLPKEVWDYICGGSETETTVARNRQALDSVAFRPRVLRDVAETDTSTTFLGEKQRLPLLLAPIGGMTLIDPQGAVPAARAAADFGCLYMMSSAADSELEVVARAAGEQFLFQLYIQGDEKWVDEMATRAVDAGCKAFCITVDTVHHSRRERGILARHSIPGRPFGQPRQGDEQRMAFDWDALEHVKSKLSVPIIVKGIATAEDAALCLEHGVDVVYISNHGGRQLDHGRGSIDLLTEIVSVVRGKASIVVDGGFCRGTDILKALAMGADMVGIGRLQALALGAAGGSGVKRMLEILEAELTIDMKLLGVSTFDELDGGFLHPATPVVAPHVLSAFPLLD